jgi:hypothetical protein
MFLAYCKFSTGRCLSDASIEVRQGRMTRKQGVEVVRKLDGTFPMEYLQAYLSYFEMSETEFWQVIEKHVNFDILYRTLEKTRPYRLIKEVE